MQEHKNSADISTVFERSFPLRTVMRMVILEAQNRLLTER